MKEKILIFIIGLLVGAVIATGAFFVYTKATTCNANNNAQTGMPGGNPRSIPRGQNNEKGQPPEKPDGDSEQQPEMPNNNKSDSNGTKKSS